MGAWDKLRRVGSYVRKLSRSTAPDSYFQYKRRRERARKQAERERDATERSAERDRDEAERGREYAERYTAERRAEESQTDAPRDDANKPERPD